MKNTQHMLDRTTPQQLGLLKDSTTTVYKELYVYAAF